MLLPSLVDDVAQGRGVELRHDVQAACDHEDHTSSCHRLSPWYGHRGVHCLLDRTVLAVVNVQILAQMRVHYGLERLKPADYFGGRRRGRQAVEADLVQVPRTAAS